MGNPVFLSGLMAMAVPLCLGSTYRPFLIPLLFTCILLTQSRSGLIAASVGMLAYSLARGVIGRKLFTVLACLAVLVCAGLFANVRNTGKSDLGRYHMTRLAVKSILEHPLGVGPERFAWVLNRYRDDELKQDLGPTWSNAYVHNSILEALVAGGVPFLLVHCFLMGAIYLFILRIGSPSLLGCAVALFTYGLMQPTPLVLKAVLAAFLGSVDPSQRPISRTPFVIASSLALFFSLGAVIMAKVWVMGNRYGLANAIVRSHDYSPSAIGEQ